ncbi:MAG: YceI family protein [Thermoleophilia bacterium]|jgi:polyisoprenoid-binding protein YceI|nr:YceI family protein [Thermoleophilia bacterium]
MTTSTLPQATLVPTGTWASDPVHSTVEFSARHMAVSTYRGALPKFELALTGGPEPRLEGRAPVAPVTTEDANLTGHLLSPDFLDAERHPEVRFTSTRVVLEPGETFVAEGELTMKGVTLPVTFRGTLAGPVDDPWGGARMGLDIEAKVDRRDFGMDWSLDLPGGGLVLGYQVRLQAHVELIRQAG